MGKPVKKRFDLQVNQALSEVSETFELDRNISIINGLFVCSDRDDILYWRGSQKIELNKEELFPEGYESKHLMSGLNNSPRDRYYNLECLPAGAGSIRMIFKDNENAQAAFTPYRVSLYLLCEYEG